MARINFTARTIETLKASSRREDYWDDSTPGFGIRISADGRKSWICMYRFGQRQRRLTLGTYPSMSLASARDRALDAKHTVSKGEDPANQKQIDKQAETFAELCTEYIERHAKVHKKSWKEDNRVLTREFLPLWRNCKAKGISRRDVILVLDKIAGRGSPVVANKALAVLRKAYNFAIQRDIAEINPCWNIPAPGKIKTRDRVLTETEIQTLSKVVAKEDFFPNAFYQLLLLTAQRSGEVCNAEWKDIDLTSGWWVIPSVKAKNGLPHRVPLSGTVLKLFKMLRLHSGGSQWVFKSPKGDHPIRERKRWLDRIREASSIDFKPHDLRRTAASYMTSIGIPRLTVSKILNHVESSVTAIYDRHSYDKEKREALEKWEAALQVIIKKETETAMAG